MQVRGGRIEMNWFKSLWGGAANLGRSDNETIQQRIRRHVERRGGTPAVWFAPDQFCSYSQMNENATVISQALKSASGASSPRVCFPMPRGSSALYGFLGAIECGTCCPLDGKLRQNEFDEAYSVLLPDVVLSSEPQSIGVKVAAAAGIAIVIYEVSSDHGNCRIIDVKPAKNVRRADRLMTLTSGEAPAVLMRTSGTTAQPKLVGLTHANVLAATDTMRVAFELTESDVCITPMPLHHVHGLIAAALSALSAGSSIHCCETFSPRSFDQALRDYAPTWLTAAPALHIAMNDYYAGQNSTPSIRTLRCFRSSSAPLPPASIARLEGLYAAPLLETYGLTETASTLCSNRLPPGKRKPGSVGQAISADLKIVDPEGRELPAGQDGEVILKGPGVISEYVGTQPADAFIDGYLRTGDIGRVDGDGYLYIVGRLKEVIKRGGHSVFPLEIDNALLDHPAVAEAVTFSIPHPTLGEDVLAAIVRKAGSVVLPSSIRESAAEVLSGYKVPTRILVVEAIPRNAIGKVMRRDVPSLLAKQLAPARIAATQPTEQILLAIWLEIIQRDDIGITDNVFEFGADPLRAEMAAAKIDQRFGVRFSLKQIFAQPTVKEQAVLLDNKGAHHARLPA